MTILLRAFWQILLLRKSPETIPYSPFLLGSLLVCHLLIGIGFGTLTAQSAASALASSVLGSGLLLGNSYLLLFLHKVRNRLVQTVTAMAGCEILIALMALPVQIWLLSVEQAAAAVPVMLSLLMVGWNVAVVAHIWRHALGVPKWQAFIYAIGYMIIFVMLSLLIQAPEG